MTARATLTLAACLTIAGCLVAAFWPLVGGAL
jgi:hypothetical protein